MASNGRVARLGKEGREVEVVGLVTWPAWPCPSLAPPLSKVFMLVFGERGNQGTNWCRLG